VASALGDKLTVKVKNMYTAAPGAVESKTGPPRSDQAGVGLTARLTSSRIRERTQADKRAEPRSSTALSPRTIPSQEQGYLRCLEEVPAEDEREVSQSAFRAAAGNENGGLDGSNYSVGGHKLPNLITVGALDNLGNRANFSNYATGDGEVTLSAPG